MVTTISSGNLPSRNLYKQHHNLLHCTNLRMISKVFRKCISAQKWSFLYLQGTWKESRKTEKKTKLMEVTVLAFCLTTNIYVHSLR